MPERDELRFVLLTDGRLVFPDDLLDPMNRFAADSGGHRSNSARSQSHNLSPAVSSLNGLGSSAWRGIVDFLPANASACFFFGTSDAIFAALLTETSPLSTAVTSSLLPYFKTFDA